MKETEKIKMGPLLQDWNCRYSIFKSDIYFLLSFHQAEVLLLTDPQIRFGKNLLIGELGDNPTFRLAGLSSAFVN